MVVLIVFKEDSHVLFEADSIQFIEGNGAVSTVHTSFGGRFRVDKRADKLYEEIAMASTEDYAMIPLEEAADQLALPKLVHFSTGISLS